MKLNLTNCIRWSLFVAMLFSSGLILAQTTISGTVKDDTGEPSIGANVIIVGTSSGASTDIDGNFSLTSSRELPWTIEVSYTGYTSQTREITGAASDLVFTLTEGVEIGEVIISASRKKEKVQEAPASVSVLSGAKLTASGGEVNPVRSLSNVPGIQVQQQSAGRLNIEMRGGSGIFGTGAFPIIDYRSMVGPGVGTFDSNNSPLSNIDLERMEVVRGPGSALYGPGVSNGVIHFITKDPFRHPGTTLELVGGMMSTFKGTVRHAGHNDAGTFGYKINAFYSRGGEFLLDPNDPDDANRISGFFDDIVSPAISNNVVDATQPGTLVYNTGGEMQDFYESMGANLTLEFRPQDDLSIVANGGWNYGSAVFYNNQGEGLSQANEYYGQVRLQKGGLFAQAFVLNNDGGTDDKPTFLYTSGNTTGINRTSIEGQVQYNFDVPKLLNANITTGLDYRLTVSNTENQVYGRNENDDDYSIIGAYVQGKFALADKLDMVLAARYDQYNFLDEGEFAPRLAFVYKASPMHTFRASYNRSSSPVSALQLNIDFPVSTIVPGAYDVWLVGNKEPQTFGDNPQIVFPAGTFPSVPVNTPGLPLAFAHGAVAAQVAAGVQAAVTADPMTAPLWALIGPILADPSLTPQGFGGQFFGYNVFSDPTNPQPLGIVDAPSAKISTSDTYEIGYKGLINNKLSVMVDVWNKTERDFTNFTAISPTYALLGSETIPGAYGAAVQANFEAAFVPQLTAFYQSQGMDATTAAATAAAVNAQVAPLIGGAYTQGGALFVDGITPLLSVIGTTPTEQVPNNGVTHIAAGYRTFGKINYTGVDVGLEYYINNDLSAFANYSWVSQNIFEGEDLGEPANSTLQAFLNTPTSRARAGLNYAPTTGLSGNIAVQYNGEFQANLGDFSGMVEARTLVDAGVGYKFDNGLQVGISATNLLNNEFRTFANMPKIGTRVLGRVVYSFGGGND